MRGIDWQRSGIWRNGVVFPFSKDLHHGKGIILKKTLSTCVTLLFPNISMGRYA